MTIFYDNEQVVELINDGVKVPKSGKHKIWVLAKDGAHIRLELANEKFEETHIGEQAKEPSWEVAGEVELDANETYNLSVTPSDVVGEISIAFETVSAHKIYHGFVNLLKRILGIEQRAKGVEQKA